MTLTDRTVSDGFIATPSICVVSVHVRSFPAFRMTTRGANRPEGIDLLARIGAGDEEAFVEFYRRFSGPVLSMLVKMLGNQHDAEEVLQISFLQIWRKASTFDPQRSAPFTWLVMTARNRGLDRLRSRDRETRLELAAERDPEFFTAAETKAPDQGGDAKSCVQAALAQIATEQRKAIEMAFFDGLTHDEISAHLGEPLGTIKARIRRGLLKLRELTSTLP